MKTGKAYGFIDCKASIREIEAELPVARKDTKTPEELELSLAEGIEGLERDLMSIARKEKPRYVIEATYPCATNKETADELAALLINTSNSLYCMTDEHIRGSIVFEENGNWRFKE